MKADVAVIEIICPKCGYYQGFRSADLAELGKNSSEKIEFVAIPEIDLSDWRKGEKPGSNMRSVRIEVSLQ